MSVTPSEAILGSLDRKRLEELLAEGKRSDGRDFNQFREIEVESGLIGTAEGSAQVTLGKTVVLAGIKVGVGEPFPDTPDQGVLTVSAELVPIASPEFESGPPREDAIELARVVDRGLRESKLVDLAKLCLSPGKTVYVIHVDLYVLNHGGNLIDASNIAALSALLNTRLPKYTVKKDGTTVRGSGHTDMKIQNTPISLTAVKIGDSLLLDPSLEEEAMMDARITMAFDSEGSIRAIQKGGKGTFSIEEVKGLVSTGGDKAEEIRSRLMKLIE